MVDCFICDGGEEITNNDLFMNIFFDLGIEKSQYQVPCIKQLSCNVFTGVFNTHLDGQRHEQKNPDSLHTKI